jgi:hypothetical protein
MAVRTAVGSSAVFSGLLGGCGTYAVTPSDPWYVWGGKYESGSLIWRSRWVGSSRTECREALAMPADPHRVVVLRRVEAVDGPARECRARCASRVRRSRMTELSRTGGCWSGRSGGIRFRWSGAAKARPGPDGLALTVALAAGSHYDLVLELSDRPLDAQPPDPCEAWAATGETWSTVVPGCEDLIAARDARHAYAVLHGLTAGGGAMVAAHGPHPLLEGTVRFLTERILADGPGLMAAYTVGGQPIALARTRRGHLGTR